MMDIQYSLLALSNHSVKNRALKKALLLESSAAAQSQIWTELEALGASESDHLKKGRELHEQLLERDIQLITYGSAAYPQRLYQDEFAPLWIQVVGNAEVLKRPLLGAVGSRDATQLTYQWVQTHLMEFLSLTQTATLSGGARGVDQWVHGVSIRKGLPTVAVIPSGLAQIYPQNLQGWLEPILENGGCMVSEFSLFQPMQKHLFHQRNHLIAALASKVLLLEGRRRSGSLITAQRAIALGRELAVIPGHPLENNFAGVLDLVFEGASPLRDGVDLRLWFEN